MSRQRLVSGLSAGGEEERFQFHLRPQRLLEYIGQREITLRLSIALEAARGRKEPLEHVLFHGPPGLGKTTLAHIIAHETGARLVATSGPALTRPGDLIGILTNLERGDVLFIDEVHRLPPAVEEFLYPAMEDFRVDFVVDKGPYAKVLNLPLQPFTLVGATTRAGLVSAPLRERFGLSHHVDFYNEEELEAILERSVRLLGVELLREARHELARRSRGTPRVANRLLRRVRDYAQVRADGAVTFKVVLEALALEGVDEAGLDELDRKFLRTIVEHYQGGPVGVEALSATLNEEVDTLVDIVEPHLLRMGFLQRTRNGRRASPRAYAHLGQSRPGEEQRGLFEERGQG
ncbi:MAG: Holliday junction branch migration DNA helicase RuvB [Nitrospinota bacterium]